MEKVLSAIFALVFLVIVIAVFYIAFKFIYRYSLKVAEENLERDKRLEKERLERIQHYNKVKDEYFDSIKKLKNNPTNADLKIYALGAGREYAELTRQYAGYEGVTLFDEVALMNDINAACAGATFVTNEKFMNVQTIDQRLAKLLELKEKHLINEQEYEERRQKILDEI